MKQGQPLFTYNRRDFLITAGAATVFAIPSIAAANLVRDAGFEPVRVGSLEQTAIFDVGSKVWGKGLNARDLRLGLGI